MRPLALCTFLLATACAEICDRGETLSRSFPERHTECFAAGTLPSPAFDMKACDNSMKTCSNKDEVALHAYFDCVEQLPVCKEASRAAFNEKFLACASGMGRITEGCFRP